MYPRTHVGSKMTTRRTNCPLASTTSRGSCAPVLDSITLRFHSETSLVFLKDIYEFLRTVLPQGHPAPKGGATTVLKMPVIVVQRSDLMAVKGRARPCASSEDADPRGLLRLPSGTA